MAWTKTSTLPDGVRERTFAFVNSENSETIKFGRYSDYPCSGYTFPSMNATGDSFQFAPNHNTVYGKQMIEPDYFEAEFGALEPRAADKMSKLIGVWNRANYLRPKTGCHSLYYTIGGRSRMIYGIPAAIAPKYNGYKTSFHEGVLRFQPIDPFYYDASISREVLAYTANDLTLSASYVLNTQTEIPTPLSLTLTGDFKNGVKLEIGPSASGPWRPLFEAYKFNGTLKITHTPGGAFTSYNDATATTFNNGADFVKPTTPSLRDIRIWPADTHIRVTRPASGACSVSWEWRECYAGA